jgi:hypothetical protein
MADEQAMARVRMWWAGVDADTQMMFDKLYRIDPANVLAVISDGSLADLDGATTLDEAFTRQLGSSNDATAVPAIRIKDNLVVVEPVAPDANEGVTVRWTEVNEGTPSQGHLTSVAWLVDNQWVEPVQEVIAGPMQQGEEAERSATLAGVVAGEHTVYVTANADGNVTGDGAVPAAGLGQITGAYVRVGGGTRPGGPAEANFQGIMDAYQYIGQALAAVSDPSSVAQAAQALYAFAGSLDTGGEAHEGSIVQDDQASINVVRRAQALQNLDLTNYESSRPTWEQELQAAAEAVGTAAADPYAGGQSAYVAVMRLGTESFALY